MSENNFRTFNLLPELSGVLVELGFDQLTPIQSESLPPLLAGKDLIGQSKTGSGKTAAFSLPLLNRIKLQDHYLQALILCPTRELATQVTQEIRKLGRKLEGLQTLLLVGGQSGREQAIAIERGTQIAVGTPGRILDLLQKNRLHLDNLSYLVLDEADKMLDMGFEAEIKAILKTAPVKKQTALFSATFPEAILNLSRKYQRNPIHIVISENETETPLIEQLVYECPAHEKSSVLMRVLQQHPAASTLVFCNTKATVNELFEKIKDLDASCACLHGDLEQRERDRVMSLFRNGSYRLLIATDVAARGLDIENLECVINYDLPLQTEGFVHRVGRTGRAGKKGLAITLADPRDTLTLLEYEKAVGQKFTRPALGFKNQHGLSKTAKESVMQTLSISGGRKDKLRPGDILGALTGAAGSFKAEDIGKIDIQDKLTYVAVSRSIAKRAFDCLRDGKIKGRKFQIKMVN